MANLRTEEEQPNGNQPENQEGKEPTDLDKLRSEKDREIAEANKRFGELQSQFEDLKARIDAGNVTNQTRAELEKALAEIDESDPEKALGQVKRMLLDLGDNVATVQTKYGSATSKYKQLSANYYGLQIAAEHGGNAETYAKELMTASNEDVMREKAALLKEKVGLAKNNGKQSNGSTPKGDYAVDNGAGRPARTSVLDELNAIDVTTPEGQAEFAKRESELKRKVDATTR